MSCDQPTSLIARRRILGVYLTSELKHFPFRLVQSDCIRARGPSVKVVRPHRCLLRDCYEVLQTQPHSYDGRGPASCSPYSPHTVLTGFLIFFVSLSFSQRRPILRYTSTPKLHGRERSQSYLFRSWLTRNFETSNAAI